MSYFAKVQNALVEAARKGSFLRVSVDPNTGLAAVEQSATINLASAVANELRCEFGQERVRNRQHLLRERQNWIWELILGFESGQANCEDFERYVTQSPIQIPAENDERQVTLNLRSADYQHPPQQGAVTGTRARYVFEAVLGPI